MQYFPTICVDNFYDDPDNIVQTAKNFGEYTPAPKDKNYTFPGIRSCHIGEKDKKLFDVFTKKFFSNFYNFEKENVMWEVESYFQIIYPNQNINLNEGWIHTENDHVVSGIIYLNDISDFDAGTSLFEKKNEIKQSIYNPKDVLEMKKRFFSGEITDESELEKYVKMRNEHNSQYNQVLKFGSKYNRLIAFDSKTPHKANSFSVFREPRLTQTFFVFKITSDNFPKTRALQHIYN
jgi:hypothetical protein